MSKQQPEPNIEINIIEYPEGFRFGANDDIIVSSEVLQKYVQSEVEAARNTNIDEAIQTLEDYKLDHYGSSIYIDTAKKMLAQLKAKSNGVQTLKFGGKDDTETTYKIDADTWNPDKPEVIYPEQQSNRSDT